MQLIKTRQIVYTTPPTPEEAAALEEIARIDATKKPTEADQAARQTLAATIAPASQYRFTIATCRAMDFARYSTARRQWIPFVEKATGAKYAEAIDTDEGLQTAILCAKWARMLAAVTAIEEREIDRLADADPAWQPAEMPPAWKDDPGAYMDDMPAELIDAIEAAAVALNPGLFAPEMSANAKKNGGISAK